MVSRWNRANSLAGTSPSRAVVFMPNWVGDAVMATPMLRSLRDHLSPETQIIGVLRHHIAEVLAGTPWLDQTIAYNPRSSDRAERPWSVARQLRKLRPDLLIHTTTSVRTGILGWLSGAPRRIGYAWDHRGWSLTHRLEIPRQGRRRAPYPMIDHYQNLARAIGCPSRSRRLELGTVPADEQAAEVVWQKHSLGNRRVIVFNTGGAYGPAKVWPAEYFSQLARRITTQHNETSVLVICGPAEREAAAGIVEQSQSQHVHSLAEEPLSIGLSKACVRRSQLMVSTDSGPRQFANAFDVPVVAIYGSTDIAWSLSDHRQSIELKIDIDCSPCARRQCPLGHHRCMRELTVDRVYSSVVRLLHHSLADAA